MNNIKKNIIYNVIYQVLILVIPLIMAPYLSRVIGANGVGIYSYTYSVVYYFMLLTMLGVNNYGNRSIAKVKDDKSKLSKTFWSIYLFQLLFGILMLIVYFTYILCFSQRYRIIFLLESLFILSSMLDINWLFFGLEEFKITIVRNSLVKILSVILIFCFVKSNEDVWKYVLIMSFTTFLSQIFLWGFVRKKVGFCKIKLNDILVHVKPNLILFIPVIAISLYKMMDKVMLGSLSDINEVGFYENAEKIVSIPITLISALGTVMLPRITNIITKGEEHKVKEYIHTSIIFIMFMAYAMTCGLIAVGYNFAPLYYGVEFKKTGLLIMILSLTLPFLSFANVIRTQYLIPKEKDKIYVISVSLGAITNLIMNFIFIPLYKSVGACIGTISAEVVVMVYQTFAVRNELPVTEYIKKTLPFFIKSLIMLLIIYTLNYLNINSIIILVLQISLGMIIYSLLNYKYILSMINLNRIKNNKIFKYFKIRKKEVS